VSDLEILAREASSVLSPWELHGLVCGMASAAPAEFNLAELVQLAGTDALTDEAAVTRFVGDTLDVLYSPDMDFQPLVEDDETPLGQRLSSLAQWCAGFLSGFGAGVSAQTTEGSASGNNLPIDVQEMLRDFTSISAFDEDDVEAGEDGEQDEASFMEIFEYVRVAAILAMTLMAERAEAGHEGGLDEDLRQ